jgi:hypothetical protein
MFARKADGSHGYSHFNLVLNCNYLRMSYIYSLEEYREVLYDAHIAAENLPSYVSED